MDRNVNFTLKTTVFDQDITAFVLVPDEGIHVSVFGGKKPHIGAVSIIPPDGGRQDLQFPGHKDLVIASRWAEAICHAGYRPVVIEAGIHYDDLSKEGIAAVVAAADRLLEDLLQCLSKNRGSVPWRNPGS